MTTISRLFAVLAAAASLAGCQKTDDQAFGQRVRAYLLEHPEVIREAVQKLNEKEQLASAKAAGAAIDKHRAQLERDPRDFVVNPTGTVTVVEFFDYRCGYCKLAAPEILKLVKDQPEIRFVFKEMPIFGTVSDSAAKLALTEQVKARGVELYGRWMAEKNLTEEALDRHMLAVGVDPVAARQAANSPAIARQVADVHALARQLSIEGTPAFIVGDVMVPGADMAALRAAIVQAKAADLKPTG